MALYALGDLHLSFQANKPMDAFGKAWKRHEQKIEKYVNQTVKPEDTLVLTGDHSWGRKLEECREDLAFIERLPGRKILLRGNHDMFWDAKKTNRLNEEYNGRLFFLQNNFAVYKDHALVGTKGYTFEGPFYLDRRGRVIGWDEEREAQAKKLVARKWNACGNHFVRQRKQDTVNLSCFCIIRPRTYWRRLLRLQRSRRNMELIRWYIPIAMENGGLGTAYGECFMSKLYAGVGRLPEFSSGAGDVIRG